MAEPTSITCHLRDARSGSTAALGQLLDGCRQYLLLIANQELRKGFRSKLAPSDLVQETFLDAQRDFHRFPGASQAELLRWLRQILLNNLRESIRRYDRVGKRNAQREVLLSAFCDSEDAVIDLPDRGETSGARLQDREAQDAVRRALDDLNEDYRQVILLRNFELRPFFEIGQAMRRSPEAARKLWGRAVEALGEKLRGTYVP